MVSEHSCHLQLRGTDSAIKVDIYECPSDEWDLGGRLATPSLIHFHTARELTQAEVQFIEHWLKAFPTERQMESIDPRS